jgi:MYXO-CTERM domain-containing protein
VVGAALPSQAATIEVGPNDDVEGAINALQPGDELVLQGGMYTLTDAWHLTVTGTEQMPITIHNKDGETPHFNRPWPDPADPTSADQNIIDFDSARYVVFRGIELSGGSHGIRLIDVSFMTIEDCHIHDTGDVALSANSGGEYEGLVIRHNHIHDTNITGEGMYLGCNSNACQMFNSLIEGNYVHHTNGPTVEQGDGIEIKEGSYNNIVRDNVIHDTGYPCILTYSTVGNGPPNVLERNVMWGCGDHAIQSAADAIIRNNIILSSGVDGIAMQPHQAGSPANLVVVHNTVLHPNNDAISVSGIVGSVVIANNALYAQNANAISLGGDMSQVTVVGNVGMGSGPGSGYDGSGSLADFVAASFSGMPPNDVFPAAGSKLIGAGDAAQVVMDDFNGTDRGGVADVGAYKFDPNGNPGWTIAAGFKDEVPSSTGGAGGAGGSSGSGAASGTSNGPGSGAGGANGADGGDDGGCGCRTSPSRTTGALALLMLVGLWGARRRRP